MHWMTGFNAVILLGNKKKNCFKKSKDKAITGKRSFKHWICVEKFLYTVYLPLTLSPHFVLSLYSQQSFLTNFTPQTLWPDTDFQGTGNWMWHRFLRSTAVKLLHEWPIKEQYPLIILFVFISPVSPGNLSLIKLLAKSMWSLGMTLQLHIQLNLAISNLVNLKSPLFRTQRDFPSSVFLVIYYRL